MRRLISAAAAAFLVLLALGIAPAHAVRPDEMLADPALEARARNVGQELRCLVCRNQSIDDSDADLAHDLRVLLRDRIKAGDSDQQALDYIHARYGDYVLLRPPFQTNTLLLWGGPALIVALGMVLLAVFYRRHRAATPPPTPLSTDERRRLDGLLKDDGLLEEGADA